MSFGLKCIKNYVEAEISDLGSNLLYWNVLHHV